MMHKFAYALLLLIAVSGLPAQNSIHLFYTGDINGVVKSDAPGLHGDILGIEAAVKEKLAQTPFAKEDILFFDTGDALGYHYLSELDSGRTVFRHMLRAGYTGMVPGNLDFQYGLEHLQALGRQDTTFALLATNIYKPDSGYLFEPYRIFERNGFRIGVVGLVNTRLRDQLTEAQRTRLRIEAQIKALNEHLGTLRERCDLLVAVSHLSLSQNLQISRQLSELDILISRPSEDSLQYLQVFGEGNDLRAAIVSAPAGARAIGHLEVLMAPRAGGYRIDDLIRRPDIPIAEQPYPEEALADYRELESDFREYTRRQYQASPDRPLLEVTPTLGEDLLRYSLFVMLRSTRSEIAILNKGALTQPYRKNQQDSLTVQDIAAFSRSFDPLITMRLTGKALKSILQRSGSYGMEDGTSLRIIAVDDYQNPERGDLQPHGIKLDDDEVYAVVTTRFLAQGGDGYAAFRQGTHRRDQFTGDTYITASDEPEARPVALNDILIRYLLADIQPDFSSPQEFYTSENFLNKPLLLMRFENIDMSFKTVRVNNNKGFTNANDKRVSASTENATNIATSGYLAMIRRTQRTRWENGALFRYGFQRIGDSDLQESDDRLEIQTILDWDDPLNIFEKPSQLNLYSSLRFDTEFSPGTGEEGQILPRRKDGYLYFGVSRFGKDNREIRMAFFAKNDFTNQDRDAGFELNAKYFKNFGALKHGSIVRARYHFNQPNRKPGDEKALLDYTGYFEFNILQFVSLKPQINVFIFQDMALRQTASNVQFSVALSFSRLWKPQYIRFWRKDKGS